MTRPPRVRRPLARERASWSGNRAFTIVELMVVVLILSILFATMVPTYQRIQRKARATAVANDFRVFGAVFQAYAHEKGSWPPESGPGVIPTGISGDELQVSSWTTRTPMGGKFDWENNQVHPGGTSPGGKWRAALIISGTADAPLIIDPDLLQEIDTLIDDGDLTTGSFRTGFGDCPLLIIEP